MRSQSWGGGGGVGEWWRGGGGGCCGGGMVSEERGLMTGDGFVRFVLSAVVAAVVYAFVELKKAFTVYLMSHKRMVAS